MIKLTRRSLVFISLLLLLFINVQVQLPFTSFANDGDSDLSAWASAPPSIDGIVDIEWASAANVSYTSTGGVDGVFYVMNDGNNLYIAIVTSDNEMIPGIIDDRVYVYFDNDHDGIGPEAGDDIIGWHELEFFKDCFSDGSYVLNKDTDFGGTSDGTGVATNNGTHNHFEIQHPLNTADDSHDFSISMGDTVGFAVRLNVDGVDKGWWPSNDPAAWFSITIFRPFFSAWSSSTPMIDGKLNPAYELLGISYPAEWEDADKKDFFLSWGAESHNASLYVMNDYINLYLAVEIKNEDHELDDFIVFNFDNNNDGLKGAGDDILYLDGHIFERLNLVGRFQDGFWPTPGGGPGQNDIDDSGDDDGVGASRFAGEKLNGSYVFEFAHPLNTSDDFHDFSLAIGDKVGFNVLYFDHGGGVGSEDGWPTFTQDDWSQMTEIEIAAPVVPPANSDVNLRIEKIEITQAIQWLDDPPYEDNSLPLARGKSTIVRVYVDVGVWHSELVNVHLYATQSGWSLAKPGKFGPYGPLSQSFTAPAIPDRGNEQHTANFLLPDYWVQGGHVTLVAFVKAPVGQSETDYTDNWMNKQTYLFTFTKSLDIGYYLIDYRPTAPDENPNLPSAAKVVNGRVFFEKVTPMPDLSEPVDYYPLGPPIVWDASNFTDADGKFNETAQEELLHELAERWLDMDDPPDQMCGLFANAITRVGQAAGGDVPTSNVFVAHEDRPWSFAHEIGHNYGFWHSWQEDDNPWKLLPTKNSTQTYGFDTQGNWLPNEPGDIVKIPDVVVAGGKYGALMSYADNYRWIATWEWEILMEEFDPPIIDSSDSTFETESASPELRISGVLYKNNTGVLRPVFQMPSLQNLTVPNGPYIIEIRGSPPAEPVLYSQSFNVSFQSDACAEDKHSLDRALFMLDVPFITGAYSVSLWNTIMTPPVLLDKISASSNPPSVTITYPNGGETVGNSFTATWRGSDIDGDPLTFKLFYSNDSGITWRPLSPRIKETSYLVDTSVLPGGARTLIRVLASDGFYTAEDQSDVVFNVPLKGPMNLVGNTIGPPECPIYFGESVILKGSAFDPEDGVLNGTALTWASDLNGTLGTGKVLPVTDLLPGTHNITLTAIDRHGNNATISFNVSVEFHNIAVTNAIPQKTIIGQGYPLHTDVTVGNHGLHNETFNVTICATTTLSGDAANTTHGMTVTETLASNSSTVITLTWNTSLCVKGNYVISAYASDVLGEGETTDNLFIDHTVLVTFPGDVNGDLKVRVDDILAVALAFGLNAGDPDYDPNLDVNGDNKIRVDDILIAALNFGLG